MPDTSERKRRKSRLLDGHAIKSRLICQPKFWPTHEHHVRRPDWTELFFDLVFAAAISQLSGPLGADFSFHGILRYAFLLSLVFLAWFGYTAFSTQYSVDDVLQRVLTIAQVFLVAVMAANATGGLSSRDAAGFGAAYGGVRAILAVQYLRVRRLSNGTRVVRRRIVGLFIAAAIWAASALLPAPQRYGVWGIALIIDIGNSWLSSRHTTTFPPGAAHFPERFGLLTIILLGEFVASVMRGIESQMGWNFLAAGAAVLSLALGFAIWSCYSDGAGGWEIRHVRSSKDVRRLRRWVGLHFLLFLGIGILGVGARRAIALPAGGHFSDADQWIICSATAAMILVILSIAATSERGAGARVHRSWMVQAALAVFGLSFGALASHVIATALLLVLFFAFIAQTAVLVFSQQVNRAETIAASP